MDICITHWLHSPFLDMKGLTVNEKFEKWFKKSLPSFECVCFVTEDELYMDLKAAWEAGYKAAFTDLDEEQ